MLWAADSMMNIAALGLFIQFQWKVDAHGWDLLIDLSD